MRSIFKDKNINVLNGKSGIMKNNFKIIIFGNGKIKNLRRTRITDFLNFKLYRSYKI